MPLWLAILCLIAFVICVFVICCIILGGRYDADLGGSDDAMRHPLDEPCSDFTEPRKAAPPRHVEGR